MEKNPVLRVLRRLLCPAQAPLSTGAAADDVRAAAVADVQEGRPFCADVAGKELAIFRQGNAYYAIDNLCPHLGGPLCKGATGDGAVTCPWHGSKFRIDTGEVIEGPAKRGVATYAVSVRDGQLYVRLPREAAAGGAAPKPASLSFRPEFDKDRPFAHETFVTEVLSGLAFPFKLHGTLPTVTIAQDQDEIDVYLGEVHVTEVDLQKLSALMAATNAKWGTAITFCLFHSKQFPGAMLLNVRGPRAPMNLGSDITY